MIALGFLIAFTAGVAVGMTIGVRMRQARTTLNHFSMARLLERCVQQDAMVPILPPGERESAQDLLDQFWTRPPEIESRNRPDFL